jgi:hypothetical protein
VRRASQEADGMKKEDALRLLHKLWREYCPVSDREESRAERLRFCGRVLGQAVDSTSQLSEDDLALVIREIRSAMRQGSNVVSIRGKPMQSASREQVWKIRQIEIYLGWSNVPARLAGLLRDQFRVERPEQLSKRNAWRAIEALISIAARELVKSERGADHQVDRRELNQARKRIKEVLQTWRPDAA